MIPLIIISYDTVLTCNKIVGGNILLNTLFFGVSSLSGNVVPVPDFVPCDRWELGQDTRYLLGLISSSVKGGG